CLWILLRQQDGLSWINNSRFFVGAVATSIVAVVIFGAMYEYLFRHSTGLSFFEAYWRRQILSRSLELPSRYPFPLSKLYNAGFYAAAVTWYCFPLSLGPRSQTAYQRKMPRLGPEHRVLLVSAVIWLAMASLSNRTSIRYIVPVYYFCGLACA